MTNETLEAFNHLDPAAAAQAILPCNGSLAWAEGVAAARPFPNPNDLFQASDTVWNNLSAKAKQHAFDSHPRIGEHQAKAATAQSLQWSAGEQAKADPDAATKSPLAAANAAYEQKFGRIFIVCATGKSAPEMLSILNHRLQNNPATELQQAAEQQRQITQLRLRKWLGLV